MPRPLRREIVYPDGTYHVYARSNDRMTIFRDPEDYETYLASLAELKTPHGVLLYHYSLMPNHIHLSLRASGAPELSSFMKTLQTRFAKYFCRKFDFTGHVWQGRFKSRHIDNDAYLFACGNYIEMNPVRAGLVADPGDWPYSSYRFYAYGKTDKLVDVDPFYTELGQTDTERQEAYRRLIDKTRATSDPLVSGT